MITDMVLVISSLNDNPRVRNRPMKAIGPSSAAWRSQMMLRAENTEAPLTLCGEAKADCGCAMVEVGRVVLMTVRRM